MKNPVVKLFLIGAFTITSLFAGSCQKPSQLESGNVPVKTEPPKTAEIKVEMKTDPIFIEAGKEVEIILTLKNGKDEVIKDLKITHEKPMHLIAVSQDLAEFYHLHPELSTDDTYRVKHTFPGSGRYTLFLAMTLPDGMSNTQIMGFGIAGNERPKQELKADASLVKTVDSLRVEMKPEGELAAGKETMLNFKLADASTGKPPEDMEKYLGEAAHFVIVSQDVKEFVHSYAMPGDDPSVVSAHVTFPKGGLYKIWAQFGRAGKVITAPFVVKVSAAEGEVDYSKVEIPKGAIKVTVSKEGFTPKAIEVKAGQQQHITLAFIRIDQENCGTEVVFPNLNIKKELPLGKVITVDIPAEHAGDFNFTCGMDMLKGVVMVE
jgi:hypothetical protein